MSAVYGPTTVDRQNGHANNGLSNSSLRYIPSLPRMKSAFSCPLIVACIFLITGCILTLVGVGCYSVPDVDCSNLILIIVGLILCMIAAAFYSFHLKRKGVFYCCNKKTHLDVVGHVSTNPSTDLLVSATYPPVSDVAYQQTQGDTENSRLMSQENGNISNEDADRMVESDPRIVLRPLKSAHEEC